MATLTVYPHDVGSGATQKSNADLETARSNNADNVDNADTGADIDYLADGPTKYVYRLYLPFDTKDLKGGKVTAATLSIMPSAVTAAHAVSLVASTQASATALAVSDHASFGTTKFTDADVSSFTQDAFADFALNAAGLAAINTGGYTKFALIAAADIADSGADGTNLSFYTVRHLTEGNKPKLVITYTPKKALRTLLGVGK